MIYTEDNPSPYYHGSVAVGRSYQENSKTWRGKDCCKWARFIRLHIEAHGCKTLLDYGCGKGHQYDTELFFDIQTKTRYRLQDWWGVEVTQYDPCVAGKDVLPEGQWDCVISTQVLGAIPDADVPWVVDLMSRRARKFVYIGLWITDRYKNKKSAGRLPEAYAEPKDLAWYERIAAAASGAPVIVQMRNKQGFITGS